MNGSPRLVIDLTELAEGHRSAAGGKAMALGRLARTGLPVPPGVCITTAAYDRYLEETGVRSRLTLLLERKPFGAMRWEELWDLGLRVRSLFLATPLPMDLGAELTAALQERFGSPAVSVRSSAPVEDSATASFAGLHDSYVNITGLAAVLDHVRLVWASLWSDRALLYRRELGLDPAASSMAVIVQELAVGSCSGVAFCRAPGRPELAAIEVVWGLNQGLVDGDVAPDRVLLDRVTGRVVERHAPVRERACRPAATGVAIVPLPPSERATTPLSDADAGRLLAVLRQAEDLFGAPQDMEWTMVAGTIVVLQSRPITASAAPGTGDDRPWYLSLHRSVASLRELRRLLEEELLPAMEADAQRLAAVDLAGLDDGALAEAIRERQRVLDQWEIRYREVCIPMAHGIRLFGQVYNDRLRPADPFEFLDLLAGDAGLVAVERNRALLGLARLLHNDPPLAARCGRGEPPPPGSLLAGELAAFSSRFGDISWVMGGEETGRRGLTALLLEMAEGGTVREAAAGHRDETLFLESFAPAERPFGRELLEMGRASYRLRDNDNLFIGRLTARLQEARAEAGRRLADGEAPELAPLVPAARERITSRLTPAAPGTESPEAIPGSRLQARQLVGQPAGPGLGQGFARVILEPADLGSFRRGDVLVCDAVDPNMTFVVPLAAGIVERRGGMLIHGAIIAREYGLPCVTGVTGATSLIHSGDRLTVDGFLGIVTVGAGGAP